MANLITIKNLHKSFNVADEGLVPVLKDINLEIEDGDFAMIFGPSGCGKSTLLHSILGLEEPSKGSVSLFTKDLYKTSNQDSRARLRKEKIGMVYQQANWIRSLDVHNNVAFPLILSGTNKTTALDKAEKVLKSLKMSDWLNYYPGELSAGQQQKVALARAVINNPQLIVADEPTGNLDYKSGQLVLQFLADLNKELNKTVVMVTHDLDYLKFAKTIIHLFNGEVKGIYSGAKRKGFVETIVREKTSAL